MLPLIDTHIHLDLSESNRNLTDLLFWAYKTGVRGFVVPGVRCEGWSALLDLAERNSGIWAAPGLHPAYADQWNERRSDELKRHMNHPQVVAAGEIGLDGSVGPTMEKQETVLREQLAIAIDAQRPVLLHARQATGRLVEVLRELEIGRRVGGIWHGFSASLQIARQLVDEGLLIGVGPILLRSNARKLPEAVISLPLEKLVLETDFPDMAEQPAALLDVARKVAELRSESLETVIEVTTGNACRLLSIEPDRH